MRDSKKSDIESDKKTFVQEAFIEMHSRTFTSGTIIVCGRRFEHV